MEGDDRALERQRDDAVEAALVRGEELRKSGQHGEAIRVLTEALEHGTRRATLYYRLGNTYVDKGDLERAERAYERALELDPEHVNARHNLAIVYKRQKRVDLFVKMSKEIRQRALDQDLPSSLRRLSPRTRRLAFWTIIVVAILALAYFTSRG